MEKEKLPFGPDELAQVLNSELSTLLRKLTFAPGELAVVLNYELSTLLRIMNECPQRLPPSVRLGDDGKRGKRVWLCATVLDWLKERESVPTPTPAADIPPSLGLRVNGSKRRPGRPRKSGCAA